MHSLLGPVEWAVGGVGLCACQMSVLAHKGFTVRCRPRYWRTHAGGRTSTPVNTISSECFSDRSQHTHCLCLGRALLVVDNHRSLFLPTSGSKVQNQSVNMAALFFFFFKDTEFRVCLCSRGCPESHSADQAGLLCLQSAPGITGLGHRRPIAVHFNVLEESWLSRCSWSLKSLP